MTAQSVPSDALNARSSILTGKAVRLACRTGQLRSCTSGLAPNYVQANLIVLPSEYADDFRLLCQRNPVPCPLLAESQRVGDYTALKSWINHIPDRKLADDLDLRHDCSAYVVYRDGLLWKQGQLDTEADWSNDHVAFLIGCSYSFEEALAVQGVIPPHMAHHKNVPMYQTTIPLLPAGKFQNATYVVSMRLYKEQEIERVRNITRPFTATHGEPIAWGWDAIKSIGIQDICRPDWGDAPICADGRKLEEALAGGDTSHVPVFWGCGVTPQFAVMCANVPGTIIAHAPGHMLLLDIKDQDIIPTALETWLAFEVVPTSGIDYVH